MNNLFEYKDFRGHVEWDQENDADHWEPPGDLIVKDEEEIPRDVVESQEKCDGTNNCTPHLIGQQQQQVRFKVVVFSLTQRQQQQALSFSLSLLGYY